MHIYIHKVFIILSLGKYEEGDAVLRGFVDNISQETLAHHSTPLLRFHPKPKPIIEHSICSSHLLAPK